MGEKSASTVSLPPPPSPPRYSKFSMAMSKMSPSVYISASDSQRQAGREGRTADIFHKSAMILFFSERQVSVARVSARRNENTAVAVSVSFPLWRNGELKTPIIHFSHYRGAASRVPQTHRMRTHPSIQHSSRYLYSFNEL